MQLIDTPVGQLKQALPLSSPTAFSQCELNALQVRFRVWVVLPVPAAHVLRVHGYPPFCARFTPARILFLGPGPGMGLNL